MTPILALSCHASCATESEQISSLSVFIDYIQKNNSVPISWGSNMKMQVEHLAQPGNSKCSVNKVYQNKNEITYFMNSFYFYILKNF